jgi:hypothetical protein
MENAGFVRPTGESGLPVVVTLAGGFGRPDSLVRHVLCPTGVSGLPVVVTLAGGFGRLDSLVRHVLCPTGVSGPPGSGAWGFARQESRACRGVVHGVSPDRRVGPTGEWSGAWCVCCPTGESGLPGSGSGAICCGSGAISGILIREAAGFLNKPCICFYD